MEAAKVEAAKVAVGKESEEAGMVTAAQWDYLGAQAVAETEMAAAAMATAAAAMEMAVAAMAMAAAAMAKAAVEMAAAEKAKAAEAMVEEAVATEAEGKAEVEAGTVKAMAVALEPPQFPQLPLVLLCFRP